MSCTYHWATAFIGNISQYLLHPVTKTATLMAYWMKQPCRDYAHLHLIRLIDSFAFWQYCGNIRNFGVKRAFTPSNLLENFISSFMPNTTGIALRRNQSFTFSPDATFTKSNSKPPASRPATRRIQHPRLLNFQGLNYPPVRDQLKQSALNVVNLPQ